MIIKKTQNFRFNMGHYEHVELFATVEIDTIADRDDLKRVHSLDSNDHEAVMDFIDAKLDDFVRPDVERVAATTDIDDSFVFPFSEYSTATGKAK